MPRLNWYRRAREVSRRTRGIAAHKRRHTIRNYKVRVSTSPVREHRVRICPRYPNIRDPELALRARHRAHEINTIRITARNRTRGGVFVGLFLGDPADSVLAGRFFGPTESGGMTLWPRQALRRGIPPMRRLRRLDVLRSPRLRLGLLCLRTGLVCGGLSWCPVVPSSSPMPDV